MSHETKINVVAVHLYKIIEEAMKEKWKDEKEKLMKKQLKKYYAQSGNWLFQNVVCLLGCPCSF